MSRIEIDRAWLLEHERVIPWDQLGNSDATYESG